MVHPRLCTAVAAKGVVYLQIGVPEQAAPGVQFFPPIEIARRRHFKSSEHAPANPRRAGRFLSGNNDTSTDTPDDSRVFVTARILANNPFAVAAACLVPVTAGWFAVATIRPITIIFTPAANGWLNLSPVNVWPEIAAIDPAALRRAGSRPRGHQQVLYRSTL